MTKQFLFRMLIVGLLLLAAPWQQASAQVPVDLELVLAVDVSLSMDPEEQRLQREGYVNAFRDPQVVKAIQSGPHGRIAVVYIEWAGPPTTNIVIPWTMIDGKAAADAFAGRLAEQPISRHRMTSISSALSFSASQFGRGGFQGIRRVIDVSGDGPNNSGPPVEQVRDELVGRGVVINGLPVLLRPSQSAQFDVSRLDLYYKDCVIGGPGAFVIPIRHDSEFTPAVRQKLILEISGLAAEPRVIPAQAAPAPEAKADCMIGEKLWRRYYDNMLRP